jgi:hypothetical protein
MLPLDGASWGSVARAEWSGTTRPPRARQLRLSGFFRALSVGFSGVQYKSSGGYDTNRQREVLGGAAESSHSSVGPQVRLGAAGLGSRLRERGGGGDAANKGQGSEDTDETIRAVPGRFLSLGASGVCHGSSLQDRRRLHHSKRPKALPKSPPRCARARCWFDGNSACPGPSTQVAW